MVVAQEGGIQLNLRQAYDDPFSGMPTRFSIYFSLSRSLAVTGVMADDHLLNLVSRLKSLGRPSLQMERASIEALKDSVLYWNGSGFVYTPTSCSSGPGVTGSRQVVSLKRTRRLHTVQVHAARQP
jgi:hypothetical protein